MNLNQVTVPSTNLDVSISFYQKLGLKLIVHNSDHYARFICLNGNSTFSVMKVQSLPTGGGIHLYFESDNLDQLCQNLKNAGIKFLEMPNDKPWLWREAHLKDPDGNHLVLYYAGENRLNPPWRLTD